MRLNVYLKIDSIQVKFQPNKQLHAFEEWSTLGTKSGSNLKMNFLQYLKYILMNLNGLLLKAQWRITMMLTMDDPLILRGTLSEEIRYIEILRSI